jgi:hypothetical protein
MDSLQAQAEQYLANAESILFNSPKPWIRKKKVYVQLFFEKEKYAAFVNKESHGVLKAYFDAPQHLVILIKDDQKGISLVNRNTGDALNIWGIDFLEGNLEWFLNNVPRKSKLFLILTGQSVKDGDIFISEFIQAEGALILHGYSVKYVT